MVLTSCGAGRLRSFMLVCLYSSHEQPAQTKDFSQHRKIYDSMTWRTRKRQGVPAGTPAYLYSIMGKYGLAGGYFMNQKTGLRLKHRIFRIQHSQFYTLAAQLTRDFQHWLDRKEEQKPITALFCVLAVVILATIEINLFNELVQNLLSRGLNTRSYGSGVYVTLLWEFIEYGVIFYALFFFARIPFCIGILLGIVLGVYGGSSHYPAALLPVGSETAFIAYIAFFQFETLKAWASKWMQRRKKLVPIIGVAVYVISVYLLAGFVGDHYGQMAQYLVLIIGIIIFVIWIKKRKLFPETSLFDATLEPEKYFNNEGVVLGWCHCNIPEKNPDEEDELMPYKKAAHVVRYQTDKHFLSIMPNRSGKGRSQIISNLLQLADWSCWVVDPKGENALVTAQWRREQGHEIVIFNPYGLWADEFKARGFDTFQTFNPLLNLDPNSDRFIGDVDTLADALIYNTGGDSHWSDGAKGLVALLIMYLVTEPTEKPTFRRLRELIAGGYNSLAVAFGLMHESPSDLVRENVGRFEHLSKETEGLIATAETQINIFRNKTLCNALEGGAFDFEAMKHKKMTVYMILPAEYLMTQARFLRLLLLSAMSQYTRSEEGPHRIMVLLDEFANLGPLQIIEQGAALISGYGVTLWPFVQNLSQLQKLYPNNWEVFIANAAAITVANVNDVATAEYFSKRAGKTVKHLFSWSWSSVRGGQSSSTSGHSKTESIQDIVWSETGYVFFEGKAPPLIVLKSNYDDTRLPWHDRAAGNPMVKRKPSDGENVSLAAAPHSLKSEISPVLGSLASLIDVDAVL